MLSKGMPRKSRRMESELVLTEPSYKSPLAEYKKEAAEMKSGDFGEP